MGPVTLIPIELAMLFIYSNSTSTLSNSKVLSHIGLWSYSIYLWHWVIVAYLNYLLIFELWYAKLLGAISYYFFERKLNTKFILILLILTIAFSNYGKHYYKHERNQYFQKLHDTSIRKDKKSIKSDSDIFFIGDLHSKIYLYNIEKYEKKSNKKVSYINHGGCIVISPKISYTIFRNKNFLTRCDIPTQAFDNAIKKYDTSRQTLIVAQNFNGYIHKK